MKNVKVVLDKPYTRHDEPPATSTKVDVSAEFDNLEAALKFHVAVVGLLQQFRKP